MLRERLATVILLLPLLLWIVADGRWLYLAGVAFALAVASLEFGRLFRSAGLEPAEPILVAGVLLLAAGRYFFRFELAPLILSGTCLAAMTWHLVRYEQGEPRAGTGFAITLAGVVYLGWIGSYLISLRQLPDGLWWMLVALPSVWLADSAAYMIGRWIGRHKLAPRLSPKKTWEGYLSGIAAGAAVGSLLAWLWGIAASPSSGLTPINGLIMGLVIASVAPLGDLGISMLKREVQVKDSGSLIPGHGGALDRLDSWLWAAVVGFYLVTLLA